MPEVAAAIEDNSRRARGPRRNISMSTGVEKITPEKAVRWLEDTEKVERFVNRGLSEGNILLFAETMVRGAWEINHQGIALFKHEGRWIILDGQHRMWAIVKGNIPVMMTIARYEGGDLDDAIEIMKSFDRGQKRNLGQVITISTRGDVTRGSTRVSAVRYLLAFLRGGGSPDRRFSRIIDSEILDGVERYKEHLDWFVTLKRGSGNVFLSAPVAAALIYARSVPQYAEQVERFGRQLSGGEGLYSGDPAMTFRDWVLNKGSDNLLRRPEGRMLFMRIAFRAIMKSVQGRKVTRLEDNMDGFEFFRSARENNGKSR